ncbi:hypothetical protein [Thiococcus pfennigii]|uniref:hypothetical protein n=1 Tax=Thiococcus pfennigii TaxID=1057 RepID=UPI001905F8C2|nr:hypothetical protein [Thiococcus pfennigii]MBK1699539.1 hypothetical protein [Thiococcus pfennigii]MBK1730681.1 hypothetical protein [Thiococcus pfennigii]
MNSFGAALAEVIRGRDMPADTASGGSKKNYTEALSHQIARLLAEDLRDRGLVHVQAPTSGRDKSFMGGYGPKGVDVYLSDEKHGLLLTSGVKGLIFDPRKNLKNRYRDMVMEALELHRRFPYAICGHLFFIGRTESGLPSRKFGTVLGEAAVLMAGIAQRRLPTDAPELYEEIGICLFDPGDPESIDLAPSAVPSELHAESYPQRLVDAFNRRNPFY